MGQIGIVTEVVEVGLDTWTASAGTKLACVSDFPGSESTYISGATDSRTVFKFEDVVKGSSETAVLVFRVRFDGPVGAQLSVAMYATANDDLTLVSDPVTNATPNSVFDGNVWHIVYKVIHPDVWAEFDPLVSGFAITKSDDSNVCDIAWMRLLVQDPIDQYPPMMLLDCRAAVTLDSTLRQQEIDAACGIGKGARFGLGSYDGSSIRRGPNDTPASAYNWSNFEDVTDRLIAATDLNSNPRPGHALLIIGTDAPNWAAYQTAVGGTWGSEANRPPPEAWSYWAADAQAAVDHMIADYEAAGLDPLEYCIFQIGNEVGVGGAGGPWATAGPFTYAAPYDGLDEGEHDYPGNVLNRRNVADQLAYLASNVNFRGCRVIGLAHETDRDSIAFTNELASFIGLSAHFPIVNRPALNHYINVQNGWSLVERSRFVTEYYDSILFCRDAIAVAAETAVPGLGWANLPWALTEFGGTLTKCGMNGTAMPQYGHGKRGEFLAQIAEKLLQSGEFEIISFYATRERSVVTDANLFGLMKSDGTYSLAYKGMVGRFTSANADTPPIGSYSTATGETAGVG